MIEDMGKTYKLVNSNLDRLEFKANHTTSDCNKSYHSNLDILEFKVALGSLRRSTSAF